MDSFIHSFYQITPKPELHTVYSHTSVKVCSFTFSRKTYTKMNISKPFHDSQFCRYQPEQILILASAHSCVKYRQIFIVNIISYPRYENFLYIFWNIYLESFSIYFLGRTAEQSCWKNTQWFANYFYIFLYTNKRNATRFFIRTEGMQLGLLYEQKECN